ncbi:unnamed protein product [Effrenium voratum]|nr:unnamed protein product [Effrenium voratum]
MRQAAGRAAMAWRHGVGAVGRSERRGWRGAAFIPGRKNPGVETTAQVSAHLLGQSIRLRQLRERLAELGGQLTTWQGQVLVCSGSNSEPNCSAVFLANGCVVCWHTSETTQKQLLQLAAECPATRRGPVNLGALQLVLEGRLQPQEDGEPIASESMELLDAPAGASTQLKSDGCLHLSIDPEVRRTHQVAISLGMAVAVRLESLETKIERQLESDWKALQKEVARLEDPWTVSTSLKDVSHRIFKYEHMLHRMRYELNAEAGLLDPPELLWEQPIAEKLHDQVVAHFDVRRRTTLLNERLSYSLDYLHTLGEHVRHLYSVRLERTGDPSRNSVTFRRSRHQVSILA